MKWIFSAHIVSQTNNQLKQQATVEYLSDTAAPDHNLHISYTQTNNMKKKKKKKDLIVKNPVSVNLHS